MADRDLIPLLSRLTEARVVTVGDCMIDRWVWGRVDRISPEAPVPVFVQERTEDRPGGAANVAQNLSALGITGYNNHLIGDGRASLLKERFVVGRQQIFRRDVEKVVPMSALAEDDVMRVVSHNGSLGCLILSDYGKGMLTPNMCKRLIEWANRNDKPVVVDPKGDDWSKYSGATVITPNLQELAMEPSSHDWSQNVLITMGALGMNLRNRFGGALLIPARAREVYDVTGAGDTVVAVVGACLAVGIGLEDAARIANAAAGVVVGKAGTATCNLDELAQELGR